MDYQKIAVTILDNIGGKSNIAHLEHCATRLRFTLKDDNLINLPALEKIEGVIGVRQNVQCQIIIGNDVFEVYNEIIKLIGNINVNSANNQPNSKKKISAILLDFLVSIFQPLIPAIAGGGLLKSFVILFAMLGLIDENGSNYKILQLIGSAPLYFLPILVAFTTANKLKVNPLVAASAVSTLILPDMVVLLKNDSTLFFLPLENINYAFQIFPAILTILFYSVVEKFFTKYSFKVIRLFFVPMMSLVITVPVSLLLLGPLGYNAGVIFSKFIIFFYTHFSWITTGLLAAVLPFMVVAGMHKAMLPYAIDAMGKTGCEMLYMPASLAHNIAESGACFGVSIKTKNSKLKSVALSAGISALFGITEPALYGVTIVNKKILYSVMTAGLIGGAFAGIILLKAFVLVGPGLASMTMYIDKDNAMNIVWAFVTFGISFLVAFILSAIFFTDSIEIDDEKINNNTKNITKDEVIQIRSPIKGKVIPMTEINDNVFSTGIVGQGIGIIPNDGVLKSPCKGIISMIFHTKHALSIKLNNGADLLFHIGIDTVKLDGDGFETLVNVGDIVDIGDDLIKFDINNIKNHQLDPTVIFLVTNPDDYTISTFNENKQVTNDDIVLEIKPKILSKGE
ncbi:PTS beta-glucoside transporter subunit EIIBCA [Gilliamella apicola]|uniref:beta-glucoside-specific PTS transporter subunit IIABC n=1 Tax=Gilliamella apicola TaxID=1196095 RepID=UPI000A34B6AB|nr:beta-glucoside-specific PTS transporter subunit IIABC [Gilliamella apicola]OTQ30380.1 PTS beta-glucoside transporter subunit EIIBCA [Gilliamella apicola]OTQ42400.1 PTS beta-glucoside transporter subunit EIIBCA [Gilliamella apicola]